MTKECSFPLQLEKNYERKQTSEQGVKHSNKTKNFCQSETSKEKYGKKHMQMLKHIKLKKKKTKEKNTPTQTTFFVSY